MRYADNAVDSMIALRYAVNRANGDDAFGRMEPATRQQLVRELELTITSLEDVKRRMVTDTVAADQ